MGRTGAPQIECAGGQGEVEEEERAERYIDVALVHVIATLDALDESDAQGASFQLEFAIRALTLARLLCLEGPQVIALR